MIKNLKKAFTIIELVIVIAVIAILAAVMIPTYSSLVEKANQSADIQAVKQMNTILSTYVDGSVSSYDEAIIALDKEGIDFEDYKALQKGHYISFYMDGKTPKVVYTDENYNPVYPENANIKDAQLMSLSGDVPTNSNYTLNDDGTVIIQSDEGKNNAGAKLVHLIETQKDSSKDLTITLKGDVDLKGSNASFGEIKGNITIKGDGNTTISGLRVNTNYVSGEHDGKPKKIGFALFNKVVEGSSVTVENLTIENIVIKDTRGSDTAFGHSAVLFGSVQGTVDIKDVIISNCDVYGGDKVGAVIGYLTGKASLLNVTVKNTNIYGVGCVAKVVGAVGGAAKLKMENVSADENVTTNINHNDWSKIWWDTDKSFITSDAIDISEAKAYVEGSNNTYIPYYDSYTKNGTKESYKYNNYASLLTNDYYWLDVTVVNNKDEMGTILESDSGKRYKVTTEIDGKTIIGGARASGNGDYNWS